MRRSYDPELIDARNDERKNERVNSYKDAIYLYNNKDFVIVAGVLKRYEGSSTVAAVPHGVVEIGAGAFSGFDKLTEVILPNTVKCISEAAFCGCDALKEVKIPKGVVSIKHKAFFGCTSLTDLKFESGSEPLYIDDAAFRMCTALKKVSTDREIEYIGKHAFAECFSLTKVKLESTERLYIAEGAFKNCGALRKVFFLGAVSFKQPFLTNCRSEDKKALKRVVVNEKTVLERSFCCGAKVGLLSKKCKKCGMKFVKYVV